MFVCCVSPVCAVCVPAVYQRGSRLSALPAQGLARADAPLSPLAFLFSPAFLASPKARFALTVAQRCVPHMHAGGLTHALKQLLESDLRKLMKV